MQLLFWCSKQNIHITNMRHTPVIRQQHVLNFFYLLLIKDFRRNILWTFNSSLKAIVLHIHGKNFKSMLVPGFPKTSLFMKTSIAFSRAYSPNRVKQFQYLLFPLFVEIEVRGQLPSREINLTSQIKSEQAESTLKPASFILKWKW